MAPLAALLFSLAVIGTESARFGATLTNCAAGEYYHALGSGCDTDCCPCEPGYWCPGTEVGGKDDGEYACPVGTCSPPRAGLESQCVAPACASPPPFPPTTPGPSEQVHLSVTGLAGQMHVAFAVDNMHCTSEDTRSIRYGLSPEAMENYAFAYGFSYTAGMTLPLCLFDGDMNGLMSNTRYWYNVEGMEEVFSFINQPDRPNGNVYALMGDFGTRNDISAKQFEAEAKAEVFDHIVYMGDYAYDFPDNGGKVGNDFMNIMQPVAARTPWMGVVGNHEKAQNFSHWRTRFFGYTELAKQTGSESPLWYSYEHGLVHFIQFSTEVFTWGGGSIPSMYSWMEADLARVDRERTPWVIAVGHKTPWMDTVRYDELDPILRKGGVDLLLAGHAHNYQVVYPTDTPLESAKPELSCFDEATRTFKDCSSYVTCVMGSPGNREIEAHPDTTLPPAQILNKHSFMYGYGHMTVIDRTTLLLQWEETGQRNLSTGLLDRKDEAFWDEFRIVRSRPM